MLAAVNTDSRFKKGKWPKLFGIAFAHALHHVSTVAFRTSRRGVGCEKHKRYPRTRPTRALVLEEIPNVYARDDRESVLAPLWKLQVVGE